MWFITLLVLALAAFFIIKAVKAHSARQAAEQQENLRLQEGTGLAGSLNQESQTTSASSGAADTTTASGKAAVAGAATSAAGAAAAVTASRATDMASGSAQGLGIETGDSLHDAREMIKILNLAEPDAGRLAISREQFSALRSGNAEQAPPSDVVAEVADKLRRMLA